jgi:hypothetical protein
MGRVSGDPQPFPQPIGISYDDAGAVTSIPYEGTSSFDVASIAVGDLIIPYTIQETFGKTRIELKYPYDFINSSPQTEFVGIWEFFANKGDRDLLTSYLPNSVGVTDAQTGIFTAMGSLPNGGIGPLTANDAQLVRTAQQQFEQGFQVGPGWFFSPVDAQGNTLQQWIVTSATGVTPVTTQQQPVPAATNPVGCYTMLLLVLRGQTSFPVFAPSLRQTQTVTAQYAIRASLLNVGKLISSSSLPTIENIPNDLLFSLPSDPAPSQIEQFIQIPGDLVYGWFKDYPTIRQVARLKWQIVQEWQYGLWPIAVFGNPL